jgi:hypothetical protein
MSRLYYPPEVRAAASADRTRGVVDGDDQGGGGSGSEWPQKIAKLIPTELVTAYGALGAAILTIEEEAWRAPLYIASFVLCLVLTPVYLYRADANNLPKRNHLIVSTLAFPVWAYLVSGKVVVPNLYDAGLATVVAIVFSLVTGAIPMNR